MKWNRIVAASAAVALSATTFAHVFWLQPSAFSPKAGELVKLQLRVGDEFPGDSLPRDEQRIVAFNIFAPGDATPHGIAGRDGRDPAGLIKIANTGTYVVAYQSKPSSVTLPPEKFEAYLKEKGLEKIIAERARLGESAKPGREAFSRCAKAVVRVTEESAPSSKSDSTVAAAPAGDSSLQTTDLRFEIVPTSNPTAIHAGEALTMRLTFEGKPLANALVQARSPAAREQLISVRSDANGEATIVPTVTGMWIIDSVEMIRASAELDADWESVWASLCVMVNPAPSSEPSTDSTHIDRSDANRVPSARTRPAAADSTATLETNKEPRP